MYDVKNYWIDCIGLSWLASFSWNCQVSQYSFLHWSGKELADMFTETTVTLLRLCSAQCLQSVFCVAFLPHREIISVLFGSVLTLRGCSVSMWCHNGELRMSLQISLMVNLNSLLMASVWCVCRAARTPKPADSTNKLSPPIALNKICRKADCLCIHSRVLLNEHSILRLKTCLPLFYFAIG